MDSSLRVVSAGSVDDGKSTLLGRLLFDTGSLPEDQLRAIERASKDFDGALDLSFVTDGLKAEREQKITIDVAYRYFTIRARHYILADAPGHVQYTRNFVTAASTADLGLLLVDAERGVTTQTKRHLFLLSLFGVRKILVTVNKLDRLGFAEKPFRAIEEELSAFSPRLAFSDLAFIPASALFGDNVAERSARISWYQGPSVLEALEGAYTDAGRNLVDFRLPIQGVARGEDLRRAYLGTVSSGAVRLGDELLALPSNTRVTVKALGFGRESAHTPQAVSVELDQAVDLGRGDWLVHPNNRPRLARSLDTMTVWLDDAPLAVGRRYRLKHGTKWVGARARTIRYRMDVDTLHRSEPLAPKANDVARVVWELDSPLFVDPYEKNRFTGSAIVADEATNRTAGALLVLDRTESLGESESEPRTYWFTGLSGSGKTTLALALSERLEARGTRTFLLDGDGLRTGLNSDLGFSAKDRAENVRRVAEVAKLLNEGGATVLVSLISPYASDRARARAIVGSEKFVEVFVDVSLETCEGRDPKGLYKKARSGELPVFTGVTAPYERPERPELRLTAELSLEEALEKLLSAAPAAPPR
jgi:bifunctional enzyme CysN/CysC